MHVDPITCLRPAPEHAAEFAALPYDVVSRAEAAAFVAEHPRSFLAIDRPESAFPPDHDMYAPDVYAKAAELLEARATDGTLVADDVPCYYVWRMTGAGHTQTGVVCGASVDEYDDGTIRRHENTRAAKRADRINHIRATGAQTGPIFLAYRALPALDACIEAATQGEPLYAFTDVTGCEHVVWRLADEDTVTTLRELFSQVPCAYIADGHHRAASAVEVCHERREAHAAVGAPGPWDSFLAVLFPAEQLMILPYDRVVADTAGLDEEGLLDAISAQGFEVRDASGPVEPAEAGTFGLCTASAWHELRLTAPADASDPVARLDVSIAQERILGPLLGIDDPSGNDRISFVGGEDAARRAGEAAGEKGVALSLHATSLDELMAVSDAGLLMPPKSTWFEPKLLSGLFIRRI